MQHPARKQRLRRGHAQNLGLPGDLDLELRRALDQHAETSAQHHQLVALVPADELALRGESRIEDVDDDAGHVEGGEIAPPRRLGPILWLRGRRRCGRGLGGVAPLLRERVEVRLELLLVGEEIAEQELQLARAPPLTLGAVRLAPQQLELRRVAAEALLQRDDLRLERRDGRAQRRDERGRLGRDQGHAGHLRPSTKKRA